VRPPEAAGRPVVLVAALAATLAAPGAAAQTATSPVPDALRGAPPEVDRSRPGVRAPPAPPRDRPGRGGPTGNDVVEGPPGGGVPPRGVVRPPVGVDPGIHAPVPDPTPRTTPVIPPPGTPGGDPRVQPR
jgi:hypothetical protein